MPFIPGAGLFYILQNLGVIPTSVGGATDVGNQMLAAIEKYNETKYEKASKEISHQLGISEDDFIGHFFGSSTEPKTSSRRESVYYDAPPIQYINTVVQSANPNR